MSISLLSLSMTQLATAQDEVEVTPIANVTPQELAAIYVLSEVCPSLTSDQTAFNTGYNKLVHDYMSQEKNPIDALNALVKQKTFQPILDEAKTDADRAGTAQNRIICEDVITYGK